MISKKDFIAFFVFFILSSVFKFNFPKEIIADMYQLLSIMFAVGLASLTHVNLNGVKSVFYITKIRENIKFVRDRFIQFFSLSTAAQMSVYILPKIYNFYGVKTNFNFNFYFFLTHIWSLIYFIANFAAAQELNDNIFDEVNKSPSI